MVHVPTNINTFASNRETSDEIAMAIFEIASAGDEERMWEDPTDEELDKVVARAWQLADQDTNRLHWGAWRMFKRFTDENGDWMDE